MINQQKCPPTAEKRLIECGFDTQKRHSVFSLPFRVTKEVKLSVFQYKIVHNILYTNNILYKIRKRTTLIVRFVPISNKRLLIYSSHVQ